MKPRFIFFDYGGTLTVEDRNIPMVPTDELCARMAGLLRPRIFDLVRAQEELINDVALLREQITRWLSEERRRREVSIVENSSSRMWMEMLDLSPSQVDGRFDQAAEEATVLLEIEAGTRTLRPGAGEALTALQEMGVGLGIISNVITRERVPRELDQFGLLRFFDPVVLSSEYGRRKPDPSIYHRAVSLAGVPAGECWHVGDTRSRDILGAHRAGFHIGIEIDGAADTVPFTLMDRFGEDFAEPDVRIDDLRELTSIVTRHEDFDRKWTRNRMARCEGENLGSIRGVLFDASGVLYYRPPENGRMGEYKARIGELTGIDGHADPDSAPSSADLEALEWETFVGDASRETYQRTVLRSLGVRDEQLMVEGIAAMEADSDVAAYFDGGKDTLEELKKNGYRLGVVSNTSLSLYQKLKLFEEGGFGHLWDCITLSIDVAVAKPDPEIYRRAVAQLHLEPHECVFVGHETHELDGARRAGLRTVSFNCAPDLPADVHISRFFDLIDVVGRLDPFTERDVMSNT